jgi:GGDEF domain-containing protein
VVVARVQENLRNAMRDGSWPVTFSIGAVTFLRSPNTVDEMIAMADEAMYAIKSTTKDGAHFKQVGP